MTVEPTRRFLRDVRGIGSAQIRRRLDQAIQELIEADNITEVAGVSRLRAEGQHYRIRIGDYRLGITMDGETAVLRRFLPRGEIYRYFP
jgi:mRNA interferase RelE/StbE